MRNTAIRLLFFLLSAATDIDAQVLLIPAAAVEAGSGAYSLNHVNALSFIVNPASLAQLKSPGIALYGERKFLLSELNNYGAVIGIATSSGNFGCRLNYAGFSGYNETAAGLAYGRKLGNNVDAGAQFNYHSVRVNGYGRATTLTIEAGAILHLTEKLHAGVHLANPAGGRFGKKEGEKLPSVYSAGFGYEASQHFFISTIIEKEEGQPVNVNTAFQYNIHPRVLLSAGILTAATVIWAGAGLSIQSFIVDISVAYHPQLGISPGLLLLLPLSKNK